MLNEQEKQLRDERLEQMTEDAFNANKMDLDLYQNFYVKKIKITVENVIL